MKNPSRRQFLKGFLGLAAAGLFTAAGGLGYARYLEPHMLETNLIPIRHRLIPKGFEQFRIVQFSDTHLSEYFTADELSNVVSQVNALSPDLIVFSGDLIDKPHRYREHEHAVNALKSFQPPMESLPYSETMITAAMEQKSIRRSWHRPVFRCCETTS